MRELIDRNNVITSIVKSLGIRSTDYLLPAEKAIVEVIQKEPTVCDIEQIRAEIEQERDKVYQNRQGCDTYYADGLDTALDIIDKYLKGEQE